MNQEPVINEKIWDAWVAKGKREDKAAHSKLRGTVGVVILLAVGFGTYYR